MPITLRAAFVVSAGLVTSLVAAAPPAPPPPCALIWGPKFECLQHGEYAKEGLFVDNAQRSFSVGYSDINNTPLKEALLFIYDSAGGLLSKNYWGVTAFDNLAAGIWGEPSGASVVTVGTGNTGNPLNPRDLIVSRWLPGPNTPWTTPVLQSTMLYTPTALGLLGDRTIGCRVIAASTSDLFVSGCTEREIFVVRINKTTLLPVTSWGTNGVQSIAGLALNGCPTHDMPGAFIDFNIYPQAFVAVVGSTTYLGGTLASVIPGTIVIQDQDFVVDAFDTNTGTPLWGLGGQYSGGTGNEYMKAMTATSQGVYATGTNTSSSQLQLIGWRPDGVMRAPGIVTTPSPSRGNDVEAYTSGNWTEIYVGGYGSTSSGTTGATWHYRHGPGLAAAIGLPTQWTSNTSGGANPKPYGPAFDVIDEVYDLTIGRAAFAGFVFSTGQARLAPLQFVQPLQCISPAGGSMYSTGQTPVSPLVDRGTAVVFTASTAVFTHGTTDDLSGLFSCPAHWVTRNTRYQP